MPKRLKQSEGPSEVREKKTLVGPGQPANQDKTGGTGNINIPESTIVGMPIPETHEEELVDAERAPEEKEKEAKKPYKSKTPTIIGTGKEEGEFELSKRHGDTKVGMGPDIPSVIVQPRERVQKVIEEASETAEDDSVAEVSEEDSMPVSSPWAAAPPEVPEIKVTLPSSLGPSAPVSSAPVSSANSKSSLPEVPMNRPMTTRTRVAIVAALGLAVGSVGAYYGIKKLRQPEAAAAQKAPTPKPTISPTVKPSAKVVASQKPHPKTAASASVEAVVPAPQAEPIVTSVAPQPKKPAPAQPVKPVPRPVPPVVVPKKPKNRGF